VTRRVRDRFVALPRGQDHSVCCLRNERGNDLRPGLIDSVTGLHFDNRLTRRASTSRAARRAESWGPPWRRDTTTEPNRRSQARRGWRCAGPRSVGGGRCRSPREVSRTGPWCLGVQANENAATRVRVQARETESGRAPRRPHAQGICRASKIFFAPTASSQAAGGAFIERLAQRKEDLDKPSGPDVAPANRGVPGVGATYRDPLRRFEGHPAPEPRRERHSRRNDPGLELVPPDRKPSERCTSRVSGLRARTLFQFHQSFTRQASAFLASDSPLAPY